MIPYQYHLCTTNLTGKEIKQLIIAKQVKLEEEDLPEGWSKESINFINSLLQRRPMKRLGYRGVEEIKNHDWMESINWSLLEQKKILQAFILDSIGSVAIEELMNNICNDIKEKYGTITKRFSPGYGDWPLTNQYDLLKWIGAEKIGISLSPTFQMIPRKSISAIVGYCSS